MAGTVNWHYGSADMIVAGYKHWTDITLWLFRVISVYCHICVLSSGTQYCCFLCDCGMLLDWLLISLVWEQLVKIVVFVIRMNDGFFSMVMWDRLEQFPVSKGWWSNDASISSSILICWDWDRCNLWLLLLHNEELGKLGNWSLLHLDAISCLGYLYICYVQVKIP